MTHVLSGVERRPCPSLPVSERAFKRISARLLRPVEGGRAGEGTGSRQVSVKGRELAAEEVS